VPDESRPAFVPTWPTCELAHGCTGAVVYAGACLGHLAGHTDNYLGSLRRGANLDGRGAVVNAEVVKLVVEAVRDHSGAHLGEVSFEHADIIGSVRFNEVSFSGPVSFKHARFTGSVQFNAVSFRNAVFDDATFVRPVNLDTVEAGGVISFVNTRFEKRAWIGPLRAGQLVLARARCAAMIGVDVHVDLLECRLARFEEGVNIKADGGAISIEKVKFGAPSLVSGVGELPRLRSVEEVDVSNLELADVDLRWCAFARSHRLDQLRLAGRCPFDGPPIMKRWTRRRTIVEERAWRRWSSDRPSGWAIDRVDPERIANLYRSLRKAFEDSKNEAGAGDFYYGEMEMRRHSAETPKAERAILWVYWLLSGYGQRAARAVAALLVVIAVVGVLLAVWGQPAAEAARIAVGAVVLREPGAELTAAGQWTVMVARVLGPVLLALAVLAVRARVKR
jgi:pentapeptide repeat protein